MEHERIDFGSLREAIKFHVDDFLLGPTLEDRIHAIEPDAAVRRLKQANCRHEDMDGTYAICRRCGMTRQVMAFGE